MRFVLAESPIRLEFASTVSLVAAPEREIEIGVDNSGLDGADVRIILHYNPELIDVVRAADDNSRKVTSNSAT